MNEKWRIKEIEANEIPKGGTLMRKSVWEDLYQEVSLRLEETSNHFALAIEGFEEKKTAEQASAAITRLARLRIGTHSVRCKVRLNGKGWTLYVQRGPNYQK